MIRQAYNRLSLVVKSVTNSNIDALEILAADHFVVDLLFLRTRLSEGFQSRKEIFEKIREKLERHMELEESYFYPACQKATALREMIEEAYTEHDTVKSLLKEIHGLKESQEEQFNAQLKVLMENVRHHVREEEEQLFPRVRRSLTRHELEEIKSQLEQALDQTSTREAA